MFASVNYSWDVTLQRSKTSSRLFLEELLVNWLLCLQLHFMQDPSKSTPERVGWISPPATWHEEMIKGQNHLGDICSLRDVIMHFWYQSYKALSEASIKFLAHVVLCRSLFQAGKSWHHLSFSSFLSTVGKKNCQIFKYECYSPQSTSIDPVDFLEIIGWGGIKIIEWNQIKSVCFRGWIKNMITYCFAIRISSQEIWIF